MVEATLSVLIRTRTFQSQLHNVITFIPVAVPYSKMATMMTPTDQIICGSGAKYRIVHVSQCIFYEHVTPLYQFHIPN